MFSLVISSLLHFEFSNQVVFGSTTRPCWLIGELLGSPGGSHWLLLLFLTIIILLLLLFGLLLLFLLLTSSVFFNFLFEFDIDWDTTVLTEVARDWNFND